MNLEVFMYDERKKGQKEAKLESIEIIKALRKGKPIEDVAKELNVSIKDVEDIAEAMN